jgi:hypothetical protein
MHPPRRSATRAKRDSARCYPIARFIESDVTQKTDPGHAESLSIVSLTCPIVRARGLSPPEPSLCSLARQSAPEKVIQLWYNGCFAVAPKTLRCLGTSAGESLRFSGICGITALDHRHAVTPFRSLRHGSARLEEKATTNDSTNTNRHRGTLVSCENYEFRKSFDTKDPDFCMN